MVLDHEFKISITRLKHIFINQNRNHFNQHIFANKKSVCLFLLHKYPCFGFQLASGKHFLPLAGCGRVFPAKSCQGTKKWQLAGERSGEYGKRQDFLVPFIQLVKHWLHDMWSGIVVEKNWAFSVNQCQLHSLQFLVHLIDLLSILLRVFAGIQNAVVDQISSRPPNRNHHFF